MKTTITKEDVQKAQEEYYSKSIESCCVIHQVVKRLTSKEAMVYEGEIKIEHKNYRLSGAAVGITEAASKDWPSFIGTEIEIPEI